MSFSARSALRRLDKDVRRSEFLARQAMLAFMAAFQVALYAWSDLALCAVLAALIAQAGSVEALRFRRAGTMHQTRRTIWRGSTREDIRARPLLHGWRPRGAARGQAQ